jgi:hypothetical protein
MVCGPDLAARDSSLLMFMPVRVDVSITRGECLGVVPYLVVSRMMNLTVMMMMVAAAHFETSGREQSHNPQDQQPGDHG